MKNMFLQNWDQLFIVLIKKSLQPYKDVVEYTNIDGKRALQDKWCETDEIEIMAFICILIHLGALKQNIFPTELIWDVQNGNALASSTMTRSRFLSLSNRLRFDDKETRSERRNRDEFAPIRDIWEQLMSNMRKHFVPRPFITVDEQLIPWRGRCKFLQYLPSKPDKYGLKVFWACDSENNYPLVAKPYLEKIGQTHQVNLGRTTAFEICAPYFGTGRNLTVDNFFTDIELCDMLERQKMTLVGTVRRNKRFLAEEFKDPKKTEKKTNQNLLSEREKPVFVRSRKFEKGGCVFHISLRKKTNHQN